MVEHWDVNNEMLHGQFFVDAVGDPNIRVEMFQKVKTMSPNTLTFVNDYSIFIYGKNLAKPHERYVLMNEKM